MKLYGDPFLVPVKFKKMQTRRAVKFKPSRLPLGDSRLIAGAQKKIEGKREKIIMAGQQRISFQEHRRCTTCLNAE
jgi:hypothetical protein